MPISASALRVSTSSCSTRVAQSRRWRLLARTPSDEPQDDYSDGNGLEAYGVTGVFGGGNAGSGTYGVRGSCNGTGVYGFTWSISGGNGVWGQTSGPGSGVYGENDASG